MNEMMNRLLTTRADRYYWRVTTVIMLFDLFIGLGFLFGLPSSSPSYAVAFQLLHPLGWGVVATTAAVAYLYGLAVRKRLWMLAGLTIGGFYVNIFAITFVMAAFAGTLAGFTGIIAWGAAGTIHILSAMTLPTSKSFIKFQNHADRDIS